MRMAAVAEGFSGRDELADLAIVPPADACPTPSSPHESSRSEESATEGKVPSRDDGLPVVQPGILTRTAGRILAARTRGELRDLFATILGGLYPSQTQFELHVADAGGGLTPVVGGSLRSGNDRRLLAALRSRAAASPQDLEQPHAFPALRDARRGPLMSAPLLDAAGGLIGLIVVEAAPDERDFTHRDVVVLEGIAALLSLALQQLRGEEGGAALARIELDRRAACRVQRSLMSRDLPPGIGVTAHTEYLPAFDVGGDFYSLRYLGDRKISVAIGDVSGNGVSAALVMSRVASDIERALGAGEAPGTVLNALNGSLADAESEMFVTASCLQLDTRSRRLTVANAGHLPLIVRRASGEVFTCGGASGTPLGMLPGEYDEEDLVLEPMDILLLMTDGLLEALDHPSGRMGMQVLLDLVRGAPHDPRAINALIREEVDRARTEHVLDDVTWVGLQLAA